MTILKAAFPCVALLFVSTAAYAQSSDLDTKAWNSVWDRFEAVLTKNGSNSVPTDEIINILRFPRPLASGDTSFGDTIQLGNVAGIIPKKSFALDPSDQDLRLQNVYKNVLNSIAIKDLTDDQRTAINDAEDKYNTAYTNFDNQRTAWSNRIVAELNKMKALGKTPTNSDYIRIRDATSGTIRQSHNTMMQSLVKLQNLLPASWSLTAAIDDLSLADSGTQDVMTKGFWNYVTTDPVQKTGCTDPNTWTAWTLSTNVSSQNTRNSDWNANGSWQGAFIQAGVGGGSGNFQNYVATSTDSIVLKFCNIRYVGVSAPWLHMDVLQDIDSGVYVQKPDSLIKGKKILGPDGLIPRIVKGLIVADAVQMNANLGTTAINELKTSYSGSAGFRIGPWGFGGSAGGSTYNINKSQDSGGFSLATNYDTPVVLAVVIEETRPVDSSQSGAQ